MTTPTKRLSGISRILLMLAFVAIASAVQAVSIFVRPVAYYCSQTAANKIRFDVFVKNVGADELGYRSHTLRFTMNRAILPAGAMTGGTTTRVLGTGDTRLAALQLTFNGASSFTISATTLQVNLGGGGTVYDHNTSPRILPGDSIWLSTFEVTAPVPWNAGTSSNPAWVIGTPTSISVYDLPPTVTSATVCNSTGTGLTISSGQLQNGIISATNPTGAGQPPCSLLLNGCAFVGSPTVVHASCGVTPTGSISVSVSGTNGMITYTLNPGAVVIGPTAATSATFSGLLPGNYTVTYADGVGCGQTTASITVNAGSGPVSDGNACTNDVCNSAGGTDYSPIPGIDDGNACTIDNCNTSSGTITNTPNPLIDDGNACTTDACDTFSGAITHTPVIPTDDGNACTNDVCVSTGITTLFNETFDGTGGGGGSGTYQFPSGWSRFNVDGVPSVIGFFNIDGDAWERYPVFSGDSGALSTSWTNPAGVVDRWMVTPAINTGSNSTLSWDAVAYDPSYPDGYQVRLFTSPPTAGNLNSSTVLLNIPAENTGAYTSRSLSLAGYGNQTVYIGFRNNSNDMYLLAIDDIKVTNGVTAGSTVHIPIPPVSDGNACTIDVCNTLTGLTEYTDLTVNDGNACTDDVCNTATGLTSHVDNTVNDGNACTADNCDTITGITTHTDLTVNDGNACTADVCNTATGITAHNDLTVNDGNACTSDDCDTLTGVTSHNTIPPVSDGNACTSDVCNTFTGATDYTTIPPVSDGNACTSDVCNTLTGATHYTVIPPVSDGNACTTDVCNTLTGSTDYTAIPPVSDGNACTSDECNTLTGATSHTVIPPVSDGIACTADVCNTLTGATDHTPYTLSVTATPGTILCYGGTTCVTVTSSGGSGAITYSNGVSTNSTGIFCGYLAGGPYNFSATDANGCSSASNPVVITQPSKLVIDSITSTPSGCISNDGTATVYPSGGTGAYTFLWTPGGQTTNPAVGLGGGNYCVVVKDANNCASLPSCVTVGSSGSTLPAPGPISGPNGACRNQNGVQYCVAPVPGALSFTWTVPANATIASGQGTNCITVNFNGYYNGGFISVKDSNACGSSPLSFLNVSLLTSKPTKPVVTGTSLYQHDKAIVCKGGVYVYCATSLRATSFKWEVDHGLVILAGTGTSCITVQVPSNYDGGGKVKVRGVNCKGTGDNKDVDLKLNKPQTPALTGPSPVCPGSTVVYCASAVSATSYNWVVDQGLIILAGTGTSCITVQVPANYNGSGKVKVRAVNCNGIGSEKSMDVKKTSPLVGVPQWYGSYNEQSVCAPSTEKYKLQSLSNASCYTWTAPVGAVIKGNNGSTGNPLTLCTDNPHEVNITFPAGFTSGTVSVYASNACGNSGTATLAITGHPCRLMAEGPVVSESFNAYPNPTSGKLNVTFNASGTEKYTLKVVDLLGKVLISEVNTAQEGSNLLELDLSSLAKGMYLISIERDAAQIETMRIVVE